MFGTHFDHIGLIVSLPFRWCKGFRKFVLRIRMGQLLGIPREVGTHMRIRKKETLSIRVIEEFDNLGRRSGFETRAVGAA